MNALVNLVQFNRCDQYADVLLADEGALII